VLRVSSLANCSFLAVSYSGSKVASKHNCGGVTVVLQLCHSGVTVVLQWCYSDVTVVLNWYYSGVTVTGLSLELGVAAVAHHQ
jgi:hypothetical protein